MEIVLYKSVADKKALKKQKWLTKLTTCEVVLKEDTSILDPVFLLKKDKKLDIGSINYLRCDYFGRYYFIENIILRKGGILELACHVDVLYTYKSNIQGKTCLVERYENVDKLEVSNKELANYIPDPMLKVRTDRVFNNFNIGSFNAPTSNYFTLTTNGGDVNGN